MAFDSFPDVLRVEDVETSTVCKLGIFKLSSALQLKHVVATIFKTGTAGGSETATVSIYPWDSSQYTNFDSAMATSSSANLTTAFDGASHWIGRVRFDFSSVVNLKADQYYGLGLSLSNYTKAGAFYIAAVVDWPYRINDQLSASMPSNAFALVGY